MREVTLRRPKEIVPMQTWTVVADGLHNAFTDLLYWQDAFWLVYVSSPSHFASPKSRLVLLRSPDAVHWSEVARFSGNSQDIRDPKLAVIQDHLMLYALLNLKFDPQPYKTVCTQSVDGIEWPPFIDISPAGWLLGRPKTPDGLTSYAPAHHIARGAAQLLHSPDGIHWENLSVIYEQEMADETALVFTPDGSLLTVTRLESSPSIFGNPRAGTLISIARPPYQNWDSQTRSSVTRLDGPNLFAQQQIFAVGRSQPQVNGPFHWQGSIFSRKRSSIFSVSQQGLIHLADLPSSGDTSYAGVVLHEGNLFISYYTNDPSRDIPWILGMFRPTQIQITRISISALLDCVHQKVGEY
jgi:hypothetical protein